jgi:hypothetical protein
VLVARRISPIAVALVAAIGAAAAFVARDKMHEFFFATLPRNLAEATMPRGGERVLPPPVQHMIALLRRNQLDRYRASPGIVGDIRYAMLVLEAAWPIRLAADSPWYLALGDESLPAGCQSVDRQEDAVLARCP